MRISFSYGCFDPPTVPRVPPRGQIDTYAVELPPEVEKDIPTVCFSLEQALEEAIARREEFKVGKEGRTDFDDNVSLFGHAFQKLRRLEISRA